MVEPPKVVHQARRLAEKMDRFEVPYEAWLRSWPGGMSPYTVPLEPVQKELVARAEEIASEYKDTVGGSVASYKSWRELWPDSTPGTYEEAFEGYFEPAVRDAGLPRMNEGGFKYQGKKFGW